MKLDLGYQVLIIEIDENQHIGYDSSCENKRIMQFSQDVSHRPIIMIRFNPDEYVINNTTITSCWGYDKNGICVIKKSKTKEWLNRLEKLHNNITFWLKEDNKVDKTIHITHLFYDE
jgi:hypothetical protein